MWAVRQYFVASIQQIFVEHLFECPPAGFHVIVVQGYVRRVKVDPVSHALGHLTPCALVGPNAFSTRVVESLHSERFNRLIAHQIQSLLDFDFDRQTVRIPSTFPLDKESLHRLPPAHEILVGSCDDVVNSRLSVRSWRPLEENKRCALAVGVYGLLERLFVLPSIEQGCFKGDGIEIAC